MPEEISVGAAFELVEESLLIFFEMRFQKNSSKAYSGI